MFASWQVADRQQFERIRLKNIVTTNRLLTNPSFSELGSTEKQQKWEWARTSENVAFAKAIEANYLQTVKMSKKIGTPKERRAQEEENTKDNEAIGHM